jgi:hypothetical protein
MTSPLDKKMILKFSIKIRSSNSEQLLISVTRCPLKMHQTKQNNVCKFDRFRPNLAKKCNSIHIFLIARP